MTCLCFFGFQSRFISSCALFRRFVNPVRFWKNVQSALKPVRRKYHLRKIERIRRTYMTSRNAWNIWSITIFTIFRKQVFAYVLFVSRIRKNINLDQHPESTDRCTRIQRFNSVSSLMEIAHPLKPMSRALRIFKIFETFKKIFLNH